MLWEYGLRLLRWLASLLLQPGGVPKHVAFIMDGNRRFAAGKAIQKIDGHKRGYSKMVDAIHWCLELGVQYITVYAFSIDNFSRSLEEVEQLMNLAEVKFAELTQDEGLAERKGVEVRILGDLSLAPPAVQGSAARLMHKTAALKTKQAVLNICFSYTSREELIRSADTLAEGLRSGALTAGDVTPALVDRCLRTQSCPPVDLLVRTSGETRLSDFMLWQASHAQLEWVDAMWPDWTYLSFARCVLRWQMNALSLSHTRQQTAHALHQSLATTQSALQPQAADSAQATQSADSPRHTRVNGLEPGLHSSVGLCHEPVGMSASARVISQSEAHVSQSVARTDAFEEQAVLWTQPTNWAPRSFAPLVHLTVQAAMLQGACRRVLGAAGTRCAQPGVVQPHASSSLLGPAGLLSCSTRPAADLAGTTGAAPGTPRHLAADVPLRCITEAATDIANLAYSQPQPSCAILPDLLQAPLLLVSQCSSRACSRDDMCSLGTPTSSSGREASPVSSSPRLSVTGCAVPGSVCHSVAASSYSQPDSPVSAAAAAAAAAAGLDVLQPYAALDRADSAAAAVQGSHSSEPGQPVDQAAGLIPDVADAIALQGTVSGADIAACGQGQAGSTPGPVGCQGWDRACVADGRRADGGRVGRWRALLAREAGIQQQWIDAHRHLGTSPVMQS